MFSDVQFNQEERAGSQSPCQALDVKSLNALSRRCVRETRES